MLTLSPLECALVVGVVIVVGLIFMASLDQPRFKELIGLIIRRTVKMKLADRLKAIEDWRNEHGPLRRWRRRK